MPRRSWRESLLADRSAIRFDEATSVISKTINKRSGPQNRNARVSKRTKNPVEAVIRRPYNRSIACSLGRGRAAEKSACRRGLGPGGGESF